MPSLAVGDVFGSGRDDVVIGGTTLDPLRILHGGESGAYMVADSDAVATGAAIDDGPLLLFDFAGTGREDLLVTKGGNALPAGSLEYQPRLFLNDGHGGFRPAPDDALPPLPVSVGSGAAGGLAHPRRPGRVFRGG